MKTISSLTKKIALGAATLGVTTGAVMLSSVDSAQAAQIKYTFSGVTTSDGATITGSFLYDDTLPELFHGFNFVSTAGSAVTTAGIYGAAALSPSTFAGVPPNNADVPGPNGTAFTVQSAPTTPTHVTSFLFDSDITQLAIGDVANIIPGTTGFGGLNPSFEIFQIDSQNSQARTITGGTVTASAVPEPVTILGTLVAGGIGAAMKKKKQQQLQEN